MVWAAVVCVCMYVSVCLCVCVYVCVWASASRARRASAGRHGLARAYAVLGHGWGTRMSRSWVAKPVHVRPRGRQVSHGCRNGVATVAARVQAIFTTSVGFIDFRAHGPRVFGPVKIAPRRPKGGHHQHLRPDRSPYVLRACTSYIFSHSQSHR